MKLKYKIGFLIVLSLVTLSIVGCATKTESKFVVRRTLNDDGMSYNFRIQKTK